ncbi:hypothetical protein OHJ16_06865 [Actinomyces israelii]|uniref:Uncharacterized protein n=1 Tax=Actinomyces israelii TaxID=1659 RepID=A0ABT4I9L1_9ACTO|nr:hypothetical protein [Actinomyces israelii]MCZ0857763.1 hypothetical protein [Actinomyces israelii]
MWEKIEADGDFAPPPPIAPEVLATFTHPYTLELSHWSSAPLGLRSGLDSLISRIGGVRIDEYCCVQRPAKEEWAEEAGVQDPPGGSAQDRPDGAPRPESPPAALPAEDQGPSASSRWRRRLVLGAVLTALLASPWALAAWGWSIANENLMAFGMALFIIIHLLVLILVPRWVENTRTTVLLFAFFFAVPEAALSVAAWLAAQAGDMDLMAYFAAGAFLLPVIWAPTELLLRRMDRGERGERDGRRVSWRRLERGRQRELRRAGRGPDGTGGQVVVLPVAVVECRGIRRVRRRTPYLLLADARGAQMRPAGRLRRRRVLRAVVSRLSLWDMMGHPFDSTGGIRLAADQPVVVLEAPEGCLALAVLTGHGDSSAAVCGHFGFSRDVEVVGADEAATASAGRDLARTLGIAAPATPPRILSAS